MHTGKSESGVHEGGCMEGGRVHEAGQLSACLLPELNGKIARKCDIYETTVYSVNVYWEQRNFCLLNLKPGPA